MRYLIALACTYLARFGAEWCTRHGHSWEPWGYKDGRVVALECRRCGHVNVLRSLDYETMKNYLEKR